MIPTHRPALRSALPLLALGAIALPALGACGSAAPASSSRATTPSTSSTATSSAPTTSAAPSPSTTSSASPVATAAPRTQATLASALLALSDLPSGFSVDDSGDTGPQPRFSATGTACRDYVSLFNTPTMPGSTATAQIGFSGGQQGPDIHEELDALPSAAAATGLLKRVSAAVASCKRANLELPGQGSSAVEIAQVSAPQAGTNATAMRVTAVAGSALDGLELTLVATQVGDVVVTTNFVGATPDDVDGATQAAVDKATEKLGGSSAAGV